MCSKSDHSAGRRALARETATKINILLLPKGAHDRLVATCTKNSPEADILVNAFTIHDDGNQMIAIPVNDAGAELIFRLAVSNCPEVVREIKMLARSEL